MPGEPFAEIGLRLQAQSPLRPLLIAALANGYVGYLPADNEFRDARYETVDVARFMGVQTLLPGAGGIVERAAVNLIERGV